MKMMVAIFWIINEILLGNSAESRFGEPLRARLETDDEDEEAEANGGADEEEEEEEANGGAEDEDGTTSIIASLDAEKTEDMMINVRLLRK